MYQLFYQKTCFFFLQVINFTLHPMYVALFYQGGYGKWHILSVYNKKARVWCTWNKEKRFELRSVGRK